MFRRFQFSAAQRYVSRPSPHRHDVDGRDEHRLPGKRQWAAKTSPAAHSRRKQPSPQLPPPATTAAAAAAPSPTTPASAAASL